jgi:PAS domain S-box-containing protein
MSEATILIVEDEAIIAADLAGKLGRLGYIISGSTGFGEEAVNQARDQRPDLVLMDIRLAGNMDGIEAAEIIRREMDLPVIFLTAHSDRSTLERAKLSEPFGYILKPFEERELATNIEMALYKHQAERRLRQAHDDLELRVEERTRELKEAERVLREMNETLEQRVAERTAELQAANTILRDSRRAALNMMEDAVAARRQAEEASAERERVKERLMAQTRTLKALNSSNHSLLHATDEMSLLQAVCKIVVEDCGHAMVWIGYAEEDGEKIVRPVASAGFEEGYLETLGITWSDTERGRGPTGTAIRTGKPCGCADVLSDPAFEPWRNEAIKRGYASSLVLPLMSDGKALGALSIYSPKPNAFSAEETALLMQLADELAYGIRTVRLRVAHDQAEEALRENELFYQQTLESIPAMVFTARPDGYCDWQSQQWGDFTGVPTSEHEDDGWKQLLHPDDRPRAAAAWQAAVEGRAPYDLEYRVRRHDGEYEWFKVRGRPIRNEAGEIVRWFGTAFNINQLVIAQEELRQAKEAADAASRAKSQFLANMSHELRTPMGGVLGMVELALADSVSARQRDCLETALGSGHSLLRILNDILDLTKIEAGKLFIEEKPFPLRECVADATTILIPEARRKRLELSHSEAEGVPEMVLGDQLRLRQVLVNLVGNAVKFTEQGKIEVKVATGGTTSDGKREVTFTITDTGIGIPGSWQETLFQAFSQVDESNTRRFGGSGLGLAISRDLVERMGGTIGFTSEEGRGSVFSFTIPLCETGTECEDGVATERAAPALDAPSPGNETGTARLLVAEDNPTNRKLLGLMLKRSNFECDFADDGQQAVEMWERGGYDAILMDVQMPRLDGFAATRAIRELEQADGGHTPIIAMTAHAMTEDEERCLAAGMDAHISKPIDFKKCFELIWKLLAQQNHRAR